MFKFFRQRKSEPEPGEQHTVGERIGRFVGPGTRPHLGGRLVPTAPGEPTEEWERAQSEAEETDREQAIETEKESEVGPGAALRAIFLESLAPGCFKHTMIENSKGMRALAQHGRDLKLAWSRWA